MRLKGWLIYNKGFKSEHNFKQYKLYEDACEKLGVMLELKSNFEIFFMLTDIAELDTFILNKPDFVVFLDKDIHLAKQLELLDFKVFNSATCIENCDNKNLSQILFTKNNIKTPKTIISKLSFCKEFKVDKGFNTYLITKLGFPMVVKEASGSFGQQVYLVNTEEELEAIQCKLMYIDHQYQEFISSSYGRDIRIYIVNNKVVASILRTNKNDFRANITNGGNVDEIVITKDIERIAIQAAQSVGASFAGIDILFGENEEPLVCEVNSNAYFLGVYALNGVNIADYIIEFIVSEIK